MNEARALNDNNEHARQLVPAAQAVPAIHDPYGRLAGYGASVPEESEPFGLNHLVEYWRILYKRKWLVLSIAVAFIALNAVRTLMQTPLYTSTVRLQIDRSGVKIMQGGETYAPAEDEFEFMQTQYELLQSRAMAERVASQLKLGKDAVSAPAVQPVAKSSLVDISYSDSDPTRAQMIANAFADAYMASNIDKRFQANESAKVFLEDKIKQLKQRLADSDNALVEFAQKEQIVAVQEKQSTAEANLAAAGAELQTLISERTKNEELWRQSEKTDAINLPQLLSNSVIDGLRTNRNALEIEYQEKLQTYKPGYPAMVQIQNKIQEIDRQLAAEARTTKDSLKAAYESTLSQEKALTTRLAELKSDVLDLQKRSIQYNILKREVDTNRELYTSLLQRYKEVDVAAGVGTNNVFVVDRALPGVPSSHDLKSALLRALAFGLAAGFAVAYALERLDNKLRSAEEVEQITGLSVLGVIPVAKNIEEELADPGSALSEAHRSLCTALQFSTENGVPKTLTVTSAGPGEGKSLTSLAIARHFASLGRKVLLLDADLRNPSLHVKLKSDNSIGLSNYLTGACAPPEALQRTEIPNLAFMSSGPLPPNAADLLGSARLVSLLSRGLEVFDLIVIDGPPVLGLADAQLLSSVVTGTLFIVAAGTSQTKVVRGAIKRLQLSRASVIGAVLTKYDAKNTGYGYDYGYGYGHGDRYGADAKPRGLSVRILGGNKQQAQLTDTHVSE